MKSFLKFMFMQMPLTSFFLVLMFLTAGTAIAKNNLGLMVPALVLGFFALFAQFVDIHYKDK